MVCVTDVCTLLKNILQQAATEHVMRYYTCGGRGFRRVSTVTARSSMLPNAPGGGGGGLVKGPWLLSVWQTDSSLLWSPLPRAIWVPLTAGGRRRAKGGVGEVTRSLTY